MKRILFINNYDMSKSRESYLNGNSPSHHQFGTNEIQYDSDYSVDYMLISPDNFNNRILKLFSLIPKWIKAYQKAKKYDIIYGGADFTVDFLGFLKKIGLFTPQLLSIFHHPPFGYRLKLAKYDNIIFLSKPAYSEMRSKFPRLSSKMSFLQWGPDLSFYNKWIDIPNYKKSHSQIIFISNGKTHRNHELLIDAFKDLKAKCIIVSDIFNLPSNYNESLSNVEIFRQEHPDDTKMVKLLNSCSVLVIPTIYTGKMLGPIGLTSFLDAIALGMPVITADNTVFAQDVINHKLGFVYKASDLDDLKLAMSKYINNPYLIAEYGRNSYEYGRQYTILDYSAKLKDLIKDNKQ